MRGEEFDGVEHLEGGGVLGGVMDTENGGAARERREVGGERADQPVVDAGAEQIAEQALARHADQDRQAEGRAQARGQRERLEILRLVLAEADARVEQDARARNAGAIGERQRAIKETAEVGFDVEIRIDARPGCA